MLDLTIKSCSDLLSTIGFGPHDETEERCEKLISKSVFKSTECGCCFSADEIGITVMGYAEGSDVELPEHQLDWGFRIEKFWEVLNIADEEGCLAWDEANNPETEWKIPCASDSF